MTPGTHFALALGLCLAAPAFTPVAAEERPFDLAVTDFNPLLELTPPPHGSTPAAGAPARLDSTGADATEGEEPWYASGYRWRGPPAAEVDSQGLKRDTAYFLGFQVVIVGALYLMPESSTNWDKGDLQNGELLDQWWDNVTNPQWDSDSLVLNYVAHPYWGATYYVRGRERGLGKDQAFLYSAFLSALYEYTLEAFAEPVSIQDLIFTPVLGSLVGQFWFEPVRERIRAKPGALSRTDKTVLFLTDPLGVLGSWTDRKLGVTSRITVQPIGPVSTCRDYPGSDCRFSPNGTVAARTAGPWGIHVELAW